MQAEERQRTGTQQEWTIRPAPQLMRELARGPVPPTKVQESRRIRHLSPLRHEHSLSFP
jgi:hypothetical protein